MHERIERVKKHFVENKKAYFIGLGGLAIGALGTLAYVQKTGVSQRASNTALLQWKPSILQHQEVIIELPARGHRGTVIVDDQTGIVYASIKHAAEELNLNRQNLSEHLRGLQNNVNGKTFTSLGENLSEEVRVST